MTYKSPSAAETICSVRSYSGEHVKHEHAHAQIMFALEGRMELEINGRSSFADTSCGIIIPANVEHGFMAPSGARMFVMDVPEQKGIERLRRFAVTPACRQLTNVRETAEKLSLICRLPKILTRRGIDLSRLDQAIDAALHEEWDTARMAKLFFLSAQRFHVRLHELSGATPQAYLRKRRLGQAMKMISRGMPLETVASRVGYCSASALAFALRREHNVGARSLRRSA